MPKPHDNPNPERPRWRNLLAVTYLLAVTLLSYGSAIFPTNTFLPADLLLLRPPYKQHTQELAPEFHQVARPATDPLFQFYPSRKYLRDSLRHDYVPLWNPLSFCGTPFAADDQSAVFYPLNWLYAVLPLAQAFGWIAALHTFLAGLFFWMWGRRLGWSHVAALSGATTWMLCGVMVSWQMWQVIDDSLCWLPLALYFWEGYRSSRDARQAVWLAVALAISLLAGHLQFGFYVWLVALAYMLYRSAPKSLAAIAGILALGAGLSFVQVAVTGDLLLRSMRIHVTLSEQLGTAMPLKQIVMLVAPDLFGGQRDDFMSMRMGQVTYDFGTMQLHGHVPFVGNVNLYELTSYCGIAALFFAAFGLRLRERGDPSRLWLGVAVFALLMGLGTPLYAAFFNFVPLFKSFHGVARVLVLLDFAVAALCAAGIQRMLSLPADERRTITLRSFGAIAFAMLIGFRLAMTLQTPQGDVGYMLTHDWMANGHVGRFFGLPLLILAVTAGASALAGPKLRWLPLVAVGCDMLLFAVGFNAGVPACLLYPPTPETAFVSHNLGNGRVLCLADATDNYQSRLMPNAAMSLGWRDVAGNDPLLLARYDKFMRAANQQLSGSDYPAGMGLITRTGPILDQLGLKYIVSPSPIDVPDYKLAYGGDVFVYENGAYAKRTQPNVTLSDSFGTETIESDGDARSVRTDAIDEPGWRIAIDGKRLERTPGDSLFIAIPVPAGSHHLVLRYLPAPMLFGLYISLLSLAVASGIVVVARRHNL